MLGPFSFQALENCRENCRVKLAKSTFLSPTLRVPWEPIGLVGTAKNKSAPPFEGHEARNMGRGIPLIHRPSESKALPRKHRPTLLPVAFCEPHASASAARSGAGGLGVAPDGPTCLGSL